MKGNDDQELTAGELLSIGGQSVLGPHQVSHSFDISYAHLVSGGTARRLLPGFEMDVFMGAWSMISNQASPHLPLLSFI